AAYGATEGRAEEDRRRRELRRVEREVGPGGRREMRAADDRSAVLERPSDRSLGPAVPLAQEVVDRADGLLPDLRIDRPRDPGAGRRRDAAREVEVFGEGAGTPAAGSLEELAAHDDAVAAELRAAAQRPAAALELAVERLLVCLELRERVGRGVQ